MSKKNPATAFYKNSKGGFEYGKVEEGSKLLSLKEIVSIFNEQGFKSFNKDTTLKNATTINKKISLHNEKLQKNWVHLFLRVISFGFYNNKIEEINIDLLELDMLSFKLNQKLVEVGDRMDKVSQDLEADLAKNRKRFSSEDGADEYLFSEDGADEYLFSEDGADEYLFPENF